MPSSTIDAPRTLDAFGSNKTVCTFDIFIFETADARVWAAATSETNDDRDLVRQRRLGKSECHAVVVRAHIGVLARERHVDLCTRCSAFRE